MEPSFGRAPCPHMARCLSLPLAVVPVLLFSLAPPHFLACHLSRFGVLAEGRGRPRLVVREPGLPGAAGKVQG